jgi:WD40 repeat protein
MPPDDNDRGAKRLSPRELGLLRAWIDAGAKGTVDGPRPIVFQPLPAHIKPVYAAAVSADGRFAAAGIGNRVVVYDVMAKKPVARLVDPDLPPPPGGSRSAAHRDAVRALAFSPDGTLLASGAMRTVTLWKRSDDAAGGGPAWTVGRRIGGPERTDPFVDRVQALAFSPDGTLLAAGGGVPTQSGEIVLLNAATGSTVRRFPVPVAGQAPVLKDVVLCLAFSPDGTLLATGGADRTVAAFTVSSGAKVHAFDDHAGRVLGIAWRGDGKLLASVGVDSQCRFWKVGDTWERGETVGLAGSESVGIHALGGDTFVVAEGDGNVRGRALGEQKNLPKFNGKVDRSQCLAADPTGKVIAVGGADGSLTIWNGGGGPTKLADPGP